VRLDEQLTLDVKHLAERVGFARAGVAPAEPCQVALVAYEQFLRADYHAGMGYLARNIEKRFDTRLLVPGARSVLCLAVGYAPAGGEPDGPFVARYARGRDYHAVLKQRCRVLMDHIKRIAPGFRGRAFVDAAPIMERTLAAMAGLGWIGRNGCLIVPELGSYVVLCEIVCNLPLVPDEPLNVHCNDCDACTAACPTGACLGNCMVDCRSCLSYLSIEHRGRIDRRFWDVWGQRLFGCDSCQAACPYNRDVPPGDAELRGTGPPLGGAGLAEILAWTRDDWDRATRRSAVRRAGYEGLIRNAVLAAGNSRDATLADPLRRLRRTLPDLAEMIDWSLGRLGAQDDSPPPP